MKYRYLLFFTFCISLFQITANAQQVNWVERIGGNTADNASGVATDAAGNVYVTGFFEGSLTFGTKTYASAGRKDIYIAKYNSSGSLQWFTRAGGTFDEQGDQIVVRAGKVYVGGIYRGIADFGGQTLNSMFNSADMFVSVLDANDGTFLNTMSAGGEGTEQFGDLQLDATGNILYLTGAYEGTGIFGAISAPIAAGKDIFLARYNLVTQSFEWVKNATGSSTDIANSVAVGADGNIYITGNYASGSLNFQNTIINNSGKNDMFLACYNAGGALNWVRTGGGVNDDYGFGVAADATGGIYVTGSFRGTNIPFNQTTGLPATLTSAANTEDMFVIRYNTNGNIDWAKNSNATGIDYGNKIIADGQNIFIAGVFQGSMTFAGKTLTSISNSQDILLAKFTNAGIPVFAKTYGGANNDLGWDIAKGNNLVYVCGNFAGANVDFGGNTKTALGAQDGFLIGHTEEPSLCDQFIASASANRTTINSGESVLLSASAPNATSYVWTPAIGLSNPNIASPLASPTVTTNYVVTARDANNCESTANVTILVNTATCTATASATPATVNAGGSTQLDVVANPGNINYTYSWVGPNGFSSSLKSPVVTNATQSGTYSVMVTGPGCSVSANTSLTVVLGNFSVAITPVNPVIVIGNSIQLNAFAAGAVSYSWTPATGLNNPAISNPIASPNTTTVYTVTATNAFGQTASASVTVSVINDGGCNAPVSIMASATEICPGSSALLSTETVDGASYQWYINNMLIPGAVSSTYEANLSGVYAVKVARPDCAPKVSLALRVSVITPTQLIVPTTLPAGSATLNPCNSGLRLSLAPGYAITNGSTFQWYYNGNPVIGANLSYWDATVAGIYHLEVIRGAGTPCEIRKKSEGIFVTASHVTPPIVDGGEDVFICRESNIKLVATAKQGAPTPDAQVLSFHWEPANLILSQEDIIKNRYENYPDSWDSSLVYDLDSSIVLVKPGVTTTFTVTILDANGCTHTDFVTVNVGAIPAPIISPDMSEICSDQAVTLQVTNGAFQYYNWKRRPLNSSANTAYQSIGNNSELLTVSTSGEFIVEVSGPGCPMVSSNMASVRVNNAPTVSLNGAAICASSNSNITLNAATTGGVTNYSWNGPGGPYNSTASISVPRISLGEGENGFSITVTNNNNCIATASTGIMVYPTVPVGPIAITANRDINICPGEEITLSIPANFIHSMYSYQWSWNGVAITGANEAFYTGNQAGNYSIRVSSGNCPAATGAFRVNAKSVPVVDAGTAKSICLGGSATVTGARITNATAPDYFWAPLTGLTNANSLMPIANPEVTTAYTLTATNPTTGCTASDVVTVIVDPFLGPIARGSLENGIICAGQTDILHLRNEGNPTGSQNVRFRLDEIQENATVTVQEGLLPVGNIATYATGELRQDATFILTLTDPDIECVSTCTLKVTVGPELVATVMNVEGNFNLCDGDVTLRAICNSSNPNILYQWIVYPDGSDRWIEIPGANEIEYMPKSGGRYSVIVRDGGILTCYDIADNWVSLMGISGDALDLISVEQKDWDGQVEYKAAIPMSSVAVCEGHCARLTANYIFNASYQWYRNGQPVNGATNRTLTVCEAGNYQVQILTCTSGFPCDECSGMSHICPVLVLPTPLQPAINHVGDILLCKEKVELATNNQSHIYNYQWQKLDGVDFVNIEGAYAYNFLTDQEGTYRVMVSSKTQQYLPDLTPAEACSGVSFNTVNVRKGVGLDLVPGTGGSILCDGSDLLASLDPAIIPFGSTISWQWFRNGLAIDGAESSRLTPTQTGNYFAEVTYVTANNDLSVCRSATFYAANSNLVVSLPNSLNTCSEQDSVAIRVNVNNSTGNVTYAWTANDGLSESSIISVDNTEPVLWISTNNVLYGSNLSYSVRVTDESGCTESKTVNMNVVKFENPTDTDILLVGTTSALIQWTQVPGVDHYIIQYKLASANEDGWVYVSDLPWKGTQYLLQNLLPGTTYTARIASACNETSKSRASEWAQYNAFTTQGLGAETCDRVSNIQFDATLDAVTITFDRVDASIVEGYQIWYRQVSSPVSDWLILNTIDQPTASQTTIEVDINGLAAFRNYDVRIRTLCGSTDIVESVMLNAFRTDTNSTPVTGTPVFSEPFPLLNECGDPTIACPGNAVVTVQWSPVPNAVGYIVQYKRLFDDWNEVSVIGTDVTLNLVPQNRYSMRVRALFNPPIASNFSIERELDTSPSCPCVRLDGGNNNQSMSWQVYPNPNQGNFTINVSTPESGTAAIKMFDLNGKVVFENNVNLESGNNEIPVEVSTSLTSGIYLVQMQFGGHVSSTRILID